jgi:RNA polymerase sigma-70 factor (ECF subfamily)
MTEATVLLRQGRGGDNGAAERLFGLVYDELRELAGAFLGRERSDHTLQPTALVHEAYVRLIDQESTGWEDETYFYGVAANTMRRILVDHARRRGRHKRGGGRRRMKIDPDALAVDPALLDLVELDEALRRLESISPRRARVVELRFFGGLGVEDAARMLEISPATVKRDWDSARAWLLLQLSRGQEPGTGPTAPSGVSDG